MNFEGGASLAVRWTIGDLSTRGFEALGLSISGARNIFGPSTRYIVGVNTIGSRPLSRALPDWLLPWLDHAMAGGVAGKFAGMQICRERPTLSFDNDVILWRMPPAIREWLDDGDSFLIAEEVLACHGKFSNWCPQDARNSGIIGIPPHFDLESAILSLLREAGVRLSSETDEQGLQVAWSHRAGSGWSGSITSPSPAISSRIRLKSDAAERISSESI